MRTILNVFIATTTSLMSGSLTLHAQEAPAPPKAEPGIVTDELNFNAISGNIYSPEIKFQYGEKEYSIRSASFDGDGDAVPFDNNLNFSDSFNYKLNYNHDSSGYPLVENGLSKCFLSVTANLEGASFKFPCFDPLGAYEPEGANGDSIVPFYEPSGNLRLDYTSRNGAIIRFSIPRPSWGGSASVVNLSTAGVNAFEVVEPNGVLLKINHSASFVSSSSNGQPIFEVKREVSSNEGYKVAYLFNNRGHVTNVKFINKSIEYCDYTATKCTNTSVDWQQLIINNAVTAGDGGTSPFITSIQDPGGAVTKFTITQPSGTPKLLLSVDRNGKNLASYTAWSASPTEFVVGGGAIINRGGSTWNYATDKFLPYGDQRRAEHTFGVTRTDSQGRQRTYTGNPTKGFLYQYKDELSRTVRQFYDGFGRLEYVMSPESTIGSNNLPLTGYIKYTYDSRGNVIEKLSVAKSGHPEGNISIKAGYSSSCGNPKTCNQPTWIADGMGQRTDFTYHSASGGVASILSSEATAGAGRRLQLVNYASLYAWVKNSANQLVQESTPIWKISSVVDCQWLTSSNPPACNSNVQRFDRIYEYGAAGTRESLLVKGMVESSAGQSVRTCYTYDIYNRRISETKPRANLSSCP